MEVGDTLNKADDSERNPTQILAFVPSSDGRYVRRNVTLEHLQRLDPQSARLFTGKPDVQISDGAQRIADGLFGRSLNASEWGGLLGATAGSSVGVIVWPEPEGAVEPGIGAAINHPGYEADRIVLRNVGGELEIFNLRLRKIGDELGHRAGLRLFARQVLTAQVLGFSTFAADLARNDSVGFFGYAYWPLIGYEATLSLELRYRYLNDHGLRLDRLEAAPQTLSDLVADTQKWMWWHRSGETVRAQFSLSPTGYSFRTMLEVLRKEGICLPLVL